MRHNLRVSKHLPKTWNLCARFIRVQVSASGAFSFRKRLPRAKSSIFFVICRRFPTPIEYYCGRGDYRDESCRHKPFAEIRKGSVWTTFQYAPDEVSDGEREPEHDRQKRLAADPQKRLDAGQSLALAGGGTRLRDLVLALDGGVRRYRQRLSCHRARARLVAGQRRCLAALEQPPNPPTPLLAPSPGTLAGLL